MENKIEILCREKEQELLNKYFHGGPDCPFAGGDTETIGEYTKDLPFKIEAEFSEYLVELWKEYSDSPLELEEKKLRWLMTEDDREGIEEAYKDAKRITLWERITKSNHEDVTYYKGFIHTKLRRISEIRKNGVKDLADGGVNWPVRNYEIVRFND